MGGAQWWIWLQKAKKLNKTLINFTILTKNNNILYKTLVLVILKKRHFNDFFTLFMSKNKVFVGYLIIKNRPF